MREHLNGLVRDPFCSFAIAVPIFILSWFYCDLPLVATGDGYAAYFPVVWGLQDGQGLSSFLSLEYGFVRPPGYALCLFFATFLTGDLAAGVALVTVTSALIGLLAYRQILLRLGFSKGSAALAIVSLCVSEAFLHAMTASVPDPPYFAVVMLAVLLGMRPGSALICATIGFLAAAGLFLRANGLYLLPICLLPFLGSFRHLAAYACGALLPLLAWSYTSLEVKDVAFWLPSGPTGFDIQAYHPEVVAGASDLLDAFAREPLRTLGRLVVRAFITGPWDLALGAWWPVGLLSLAALPAALRRRDRTALFVWLIVVAGWLVLVPVHYEPRYYIIQASALSAGAAFTVGSVVQQPRARRFAILAAPLLILSVLISRYPSAQRRWDFMSKAGIVIAEVHRIADFISSFPPGCVGTEMVAYRNTPLRFVFRQRRMEHRLCCCGIDDDSVGFVQLARFPLLDPARPVAGFVLMEAPSDQAFLQLFRRSE